MQDKSFAERESDRYCGGHAPSTRPASIASTQPDPSIYIEGPRRRTSTVSTQPGDAIPFGGPRGPTSIASTQPEGSLPFGGSQGVHSLQSLRLTHRDTILQSHEAPVDATREPSIKAPPRTSTAAMKTSEGLYNFPLGLKLKIEMKSDLVPAF
jgi:hypothetical protein